MILNYSSFFQELPFHPLNSGERLITETGAWVNSSSVSALLESRDLFEDVIVSPDTKNSQEYPFENGIESKYYKIKQMGHIFQNNRKHGFFSFSLQSTQSDIKKKIRF